MKVVVGYFLSLRTQKGIRFKEIIPLLITISTSCNASMC
ncbi:MAG: hypothetical protein ACI8PV_000510, partial [Dinoroseobacter sp.]